MARPKKENAKRDTYLLRLSEREREMLNYIQAETGYSVAEILRMGLRSEYVKTRSEYEFSRKLGTNLYIQK